MKLTTLFALAVFTGQSFAATPAENAIAQAVANIQKEPNHYPYYNALAMAYARRARETADVQFYAKAEEVLKKSFSLAPDNFDGLKVETWLQLGRHEFNKALVTATKLNKLSPDDVAVYGDLVDANIELGNYDAAIDAAQWMLNLRAGNVAGLVRAGYLRELHGNLSGALEVMQMAYDAAPPSETEDRAWLLTQISHLELVSGDLAKAEVGATSALALFPDYHYGLGALAQVRIAQGRFDDAVTLLRKRYELAPYPENLYALGEAQELAGQKEEARRSFAKFETEARAQVSLPDNANLELIAYYIDHAGEPAKALEIASHELEQRHDIFTLDSYAWALSASGNDKAAEGQIERALAIGVKDPTLLYHAGAIALHLQQTNKAVGYLKDAAARYSREAAALLGSLAGGTKAEGN